MMNREQLFLINRGSQIGNNLKALVDRKIRERHRGERRLAERCTTKHQFQARNSCIADARSYRVASQRFKSWLTAA
jgi:hypothetical protein